MTKTMRVLLGMGCLGFSVLSSYALYAAAEGSNSWNPVLAGMLGIGAALSFGMFMLCGHYLTSGVARLILGGIGSYMLMLTALLIGCWASGGILPEAIELMPVIIRLGAPNLAPLIGMAGVASFLILPVRRGRDL